MPTVPTSNSGISETNNGSRFIPASVRPDGTARKEIRVRPGYRPPEDVEVYKNKAAEAFKNRGNFVPGAEPSSDKDDGKKGTAASNKNAKKRAAKKKAKETEGTTSEPAKATTPAEKKPTVETKPTPEPTTLNSARTKTDLSEEEKEKQAKAIRKKIRQATELKERKAGGENLLPEQLEKVIRLSELTRQLKSLGFDA